MTLHMEQLCIGYIITKNALINLEEDLSIIKTKEKKFIEALSNESGLIFTEVRALVDDAYKDKSNGDALIPLFTAALETREVKE